MSGSAKALAVARYTVLRIGLFLAVWLILELVTPLSIGWTLIGAILMSGAISVVVLDRPRGEAGQAVGGFFRRINDRIEASARAEDFDDEPVRGDSGRGQSSTEHDAVGEQQDAGGLQGGDQGGPGRG